MGPLGCVTAAQRQAKLEQIPKLSHPLARKLMRSEFKKFRALIERSSTRGACEYTWGGLAHGMKPLITSLYSPELRNFLKLVSTYKRTYARCYRDVPDETKTLLSDLQVVALRRIKRAENLARRAYHRAQKDVYATEAMLEDPSDVSTKLLRLRRKPRRHTRRAARRRYPSLGLLYPLPGRRMGSPYGWRRSPISHRWKFHTGVDIGARRGTPILAAAAGIVVRARWMGSCGYGVILKHPGLGGHRRVTTTYCHMSRILVRRKQRVRRGQPIGRVGSTGNSTGPHLHFSIHINRRHVNPKHHFRSHP